MGFPGFFVQCQTPGPVKFPGRGAARYGRGVIYCAAETLRPGILGHGSSTYCHDCGYDHAYCQRKTLAVHRSSSNLEMNLAESPGTANARTWTGLRPKNHSAAVRSTRSDTFVHQGVAVKLQCAVLPLFLS